MASATGLVVALTPAVVPYEGLDQFLALPANLIPRAIWPDKPMLSRGVWFSSTFRGLEEDTTSWSAMTIFSEGYLFFGWTGTVLAMLIAGACARRRSSPLNTPRLALVYLALVPTILQIEPELSSYLTSLVQRSLVFLRRVRRAHAYQGPGPGIAADPHMTKPRVLVVADYYLPGFRAGGPVRAISNTIGRLASGADFFVVTRDHDADGATYRDVQPGRWTDGAAGRVLYAPRLTPRRATMRRGQRLRRDLAEQFLFEGLDRCARVPADGTHSAPVLLAPRGEFSPGALALKRVERRSADACCDGPDACARFSGWPHRNSNAGDWAGSRRLGRHVCA